MKSTNGWLVAFLIVACLVVGVSLGYWAHADTKEVEVVKNVTVENPVNVALQAEVAQLKAQLETAAGEPEVVDTNAVLFEDAKSEFMAELADHDKYLQCGGDEYDEDQLSISKVYEGWTVQQYLDRHGDLDESVVSFKAKVKYSDADVEAKCYKTYEVRVAFEEGEDPVVKILPA